MEPEVIDTPQIEESLREANRLYLIFKEALAACSLEGQDYGYTSNAYAAAVKWRKEACAQWLDACYHHANLCQRQMLSESAVVEA